MAYASASIVYHKDGASTGGNSKDAKKSMIADYYGVKNKLVVTRKFFYYALPVVYIGMLVAIVNRIRRKQWDRVKMIVRILCS